MDIDQASTFLCGSILIGIGLIVIVATIVIINNIFSRYWKPVQWVHNMPGMPNQRFVTEEELKSLDRTKEPALNK
jgi:hypothetical protein